MSDNEAAAAAAAAAVVAVREAVVHGLEFADVDVEDITAGAKVEEGKK